jgi:NAD-dependent dihydropyrimidine dehydrogenase PreA subunit
MRQTCAEGVYEQLADALDRLPNGFPRTPSHAEIPLLRRIFSSADASLAACLTGDRESVETVAARAGIPTAGIRKRLLAMAKRGLVWFDKQAGEPRFRLAPFVVGIYEAQLGNMDHELAHLFEHYMLDGGAAGIMGPEPAVHRVVPTQGSAKSEWILPYDDVRAILEGAKSFRAMDCICRVQQQRVGRGCALPLRNCLSFSSRESAPGPHIVSREEALAILDEAEAAGLVHTVSNVRDGVSYFCNCCGCCCGVLRGITEWGLENSVAHANYLATIDPDECTGCGTCVERCQVNAIAEQEGVTAVCREKCLGCGLCVTACPTGAAALHPKPEAEIVPPPVDFAAWERERLRNRGRAE